MSDIVQIKIKEIKTQEVMTVDKKKSTQSPKTKAIHEKSASSKELVRECKTTGTGPGNKHSNHKK